MANQHAGHGTGLPPELTSSRQKSERANGASGPVNGASGPGMLPGYWQL